MKTEETKYTLDESGLIKEEIKISEHVVPEEVKVNFIDLSTFSREIEQLERQKSDLTIRRDELISSYVSPIDQLNDQIAEVQAVIDSKKAKVETIKREVPEIVEVPVEGPVIETPIEVVTPVE